MTITQIYLAGWMLTLCIMCVIPLPRQTAIGDAAASVLLLVWPLVWVMAIISAIIRMRDR